MRIILAGVAVGSLAKLELDRLKQALTKIDEEGVHLIWLQGQSCNGCTVSFLNLQETYDESSWEGAGNGLTFSQDSVQIEDVLFNVLDLHYHPTIMGAAGELAIEELKRYFPIAEGHLLVVEGSIPVDAVDKVGENACKIGRDKDGTEYKALDAFTNISKGAEAIIAVGNCSSFGGVPKAASDYNYKRSGALSAQEVLATLGSPWSSIPLINLPGCPTNGWWLFESIVDVLGWMGGGSLPTLDEFNRPITLYGSTIHSANCPRYQDYLSHIYQNSPGEYIQPLAGADPFPGPSKNLPNGTTESYAGGCLKNVGCKGMSAHGSCSIKDTTYANNNSPASDDNYYTKLVKGQWSGDRKNLNDSSLSSCIHSNSPCIGCTEKGFPDRFSPFMDY